MTLRLISSARELATHLDWIFDGPLLNPLRRIVAELIVVAGPWLLTIVTLILISQTAQPSLGAEALEDMRLAVVYAFMLAPLIATPLGIVAARSITNIEAPPDKTALGALMLVACGFSGITAQLLAITVTLALRLSDTALALAFLVLTSSSAMLWTAFIVLGACRARRRLILAFSVGMAAAVSLSVLTVKTSQTSADLVWCFAAGITLSLGLCFAPFCLAGLESKGLHRAWARMLGTARTTWPLALGAMFAIAGVWADKWVAWGGSGGLTSTAGFLHSPTYDSALFLAHLSAVPGLAVLALYFDVPFREAMARFRSALSRGASLDRAERAGEALGVTIWTGIQHSMIAQLALSAAFLLIAPVAATLAGLRLDQFLILRTGIVGTFLHVFFLAASAVLILFNRKLVFLTAQFLFLAINLGVSLVLSTAIRMTALGFTLAALVGGIFAIVFVYATIREILRYHFLDGNDVLFFGK
ncbi:exopolysaccharide Pel transporter PelG [Sulfitobacter sp. JBTF-M27]|uniref:Exopolysaccharide Pel transporter PelG n=1 Tax=Sulfitobacter sediminilitoris TaxID=2698830 RepID=A0A6P0CIQ7_9RHOB|nr:exopolysaccharide Pel transporter PelG [Sulfitobacter sediminilitoris]NEK24976.1 exopolysaccharide Pel transporter PelG [Sulfitobacter sediminilitoris]